MKILRNHDDYKLLFVEIATGVSFCSHTKFFIRHSSDYNLGELIRRKNLYLDEMMQGEFLTEAYKLKLLKEHGLWGDKDEDDILALELVISDNTRLMEKMTVPSQKEMIKTILDGKRKELKILQDKKNNLVGDTREYYGSKYMSDIIVQSSFFKDKECQTPAYSEEEFESLPDGEIHPLHNSYNVFLKKFGEKTMRSLVTLPFILNQLSYCKTNISTFFGKPVVSHTHFQMDLIGKGLRNLSVIDGAEGDPPEINEETNIQELLDWYDSNYSIIVTKSKSGSNTSGVTTSKKYVS